MRTKRWIHREGDIRMRTTACSIISDTKERKEGYLGKKNVNGWIDTDR